MERILKTDWVSVLNLRQIALFLCCCKKDESKTEIVETREEEKLPFMSSFGKSTRATKHKHVEFLTRSDQRRCTHSHVFTSPSGRANVKNTVDFWVPDIHSVQPEQEDYFKCQAESCALTDSDSCTSASTPTPRRRNTMPSSVYFRSPLQTEDIRESTNQLKADLHQSSAWNTIGSEEGGRNGEMVGELVYKMEADELHRDSRVKVHLQSAIKLPVFPHGRELRVVIHNHADSRHVETIESSIEQSSVTINKVLHASAGNCIDVMLLDPNCQDALLAHGMATIHVVKDNSPSDEIFKIEKVEQFSRKLNSLCGARLLISLEQGRSNQQFHVDLRKLEFNDITRFYDKYVYVKATLYYRFKKIKSNKTQAILLRKTYLQYTINKLLPFALMSSELSEHMLVINLMERSLLRQDILLGREVFGPSLRNFDETLTIWGRVDKSVHPLCWQCNL